MTQARRQHAGQNISPLALQRIGAIEQLAGHKVLVIGDIMLDAYLAGDAERISPEAPVPVVLVQETRQLVGGAGNVARNIKALGGVPLLIGVCGQDAAAATLRHCLEQDAIPAGLLSVPNRPTTTKTRVLARQQQVLRFDQEASVPLAGKETARLLHLVEQELPESKAVIISDYGKGVVTSLFMKKLRTLLASQPRPLPLLVDPKPQNIHAYKGVTLLTPNAKETSEAAHMPTKNQEEILAAGRAIMQKLRCEHLVTTLGAKGMAVFENPSSVWHIPTTARRVFDVTGAGDTVIATIALGLASGSSLVESCVLANYAAGIVVGEVGSATATPAQVAEAIATLPPPTVQQWA